MPFGQKISQKLRTKKLPPNKTNIVERDIQDEIKEDEIDENIEYIRNILNMYYAHIILKILWINIRLKC
ncbi:hypothetical protein KBH77_02655 [Patescibacteria group bacterium]|nr:hypothetical protein [Patescibacteria group bacterium]